MDIWIEGLLILANFLIFAAFLVVYFELAAITNRLDRIEQQKERGE